MDQIKRTTRRRIAYWTMILISAVVVRALLPPDIDDKSAGLLMVIVPSLVGIIAAFIGGDVYDGHSERKNKGDWMEPSTWVIIALLLFGGNEHLQKKAAKAEVTRLEASLHQAKENTKKAIEVNETNADTITTIDNSRLQCLRDLKESRVRQANYSRINQDSQVRLEELEGIIDSYDWSSVRIPDGLVDQITTNWDRCRSRYRV